ncbi:MAG: hypothetical protein KZQ83_19820 [gamma proteobacterium symbiont of Taylorina sp.]|nr:hypothetical protein [gamma proteobacterium symbiont of Taylorina sp.]
MHKITITIFFSLLFLSLVNPVVADFEAAIEANQQGDRDTAFNEFYRAVQKKDQRAYGKLGSMYLYGLGTKKDYFNAYIWFHMAYLSGENEGERFRDAASSMMNRDEFLKAVEAAESQRIVQGLGKTPPQNKPPVMKKPAA